MADLNDIFFTAAVNEELTYEQVLEEVQKYFAENYASTIAAPEKEIPKRQQSF